MTDTLDLVTVIQMACDSVEYQAVKLELAIKYLDLRLIRNLSEHCNFHLKGGNLLDNEIQSVIQQN